MLNWLCPSWSGLPPHPEVGLSTSGNLIQKPLVELHLLVTPDAPKLTVSSDLHKVQTSSSQIQLPLWDVLYTHV